MYFVIMFLLILELARECGESRHEDEVRQKQGILSAPPLPPAQPSVELTEP